MFKKIIISAAIMVCTASWAAKEITVIRPSPAGGNDSAWSEATTEALEKSGYRVNSLAFNNCREVVSWVANNPTVPYILTTTLVPFMTSMAQPSHPAGCDIKINKETLVTLVTKSYLMVCSRDMDRFNLRHLSSGVPTTVAMNGQPLYVVPMQQQLTDLGMTNVKIVRFATGKDLFRAFVAGDTDYLAIVNESSATQVKAQCFLTTGSPDTVKKMVSTTPRISTQTIKQDISFKDYGVYVGVLGSNINRAEVQGILARALKDPQSLMAKVTDHTILKGVFSGQSDAAQLAEMEHAVAAVTSILK
jgi:hypothetical protein